MRKDFKHPILGQSIGGYLNEDNHFVMVYEFGIENLIKQADGSIERTIQLSNEVAEELRRIVDEK